MKIITVLLGALFLFTGCSDNEKVIPSFPEMPNPLNDPDNLKSTFEDATELEDLTVIEDGVGQIYKLSNGELFSGWIKKTYENKKVGYLFHCMDGKQDGLYTAWHDNGKKMVERTWKKGVRHGPFRNWTAAGILVSRGFNKDNQLDALYEEFYNNGNKKSDIIYREGKIQSFARWKPDGVACPLTKLQNGTGVVYHYREDGSVDSNESYFEGEFDYGRPSDLDDTFTENVEIEEQGLELNSSIIPLRE